MKFVFLFYFRNFQFNKVFFFSTSVQCFLCSLFARLLRPTSCGKERKSFWKLICRQSRNHLQQKRLRIACFTLDLTRIIRQLIFSATKSRQFQFFIHSSRSASFAARWFFTFRIVFFSQSLLRIFIAFFPLSLLFFPRRKARHFHPDHFVLGVG